MLSPQKNIPTIVVIFGATGDLMAKKIAPALFRLHESGALPDLFSAVGFSRRPMSDSEFQSYVGALLTKHDPGIKSHDQAAFLSRWSYSAGVFEEKKDYLSLAAQLKAMDDAWGVCSNKLFYLAVPPRAYETIFRNLSDSGLTLPCSPEEGWTRVIVEKPFGDDLETARKLDELLSSLFKEEQIYRIDHYLAKEMLQNILAFRFSNNLFEKNWSNALIERIHIRLLETIGVEERGSFYDGVGALRDVGQNHLLQMLALVTMVQPSALDATSIRPARARALESVHVPTKEEIGRDTFRAQYEGYRSIKGVRTDSDTETYFKMRLSLESPDWRGVEVICESGKRLEHQIKEIEILFRHPAPCLCPPGRAHYRNTLIVHLEPREGITIRFWVKKPGLSLEMEERTFDFTFREQGKKAQYTEEYEKLLMDCITGDQTRFISSDEVRAMWRVIDPIIEAWQKGEVPLARYAPGNTSISGEADMKLYGKGSLFSARHIGIIGLGKMGGNIARRLHERGWHVQGFNKEAHVTELLEKEAVLSGAKTISSLIESLPQPRIIWLMIPGNVTGEEAPVDTLLFGPHGLSSALSKGDIVIDGGNSFYRDSERRAERLKAHGIHFLDVGVSGGPHGARFGASLMIGGDEDIYRKIEPLFKDLALPGGYAHVGKSGAGHFVKMVHNGIEYGMMQAIAEGFAVLEKSSFGFNLKGIADMYNRGSVIASRLIGWLASGFQKFGPELKNVSGSVEHTGEGAWTLETAKELGVPAPIIEEALQFRIKSKEKPSYTGKILSALRNQFGGHEAQEKSK